MIGLIFEWLYRMTDEAFDGVWGQKYSPPPNSPVHSRDTFGAETPPQTLRKIMLPALALKGIVRCANFPMRYIDVAHSGKGRYFCGTCRREIEAKRGDARSNAKVDT